MCILAESQKYSLLQSIYYMLLLTLMANNLLHTIENNAASQSGTSIGMLYLFELGHTLE